MNTTLENIIVSCVGIAAVLFLIRKKIWPKKKDKNCGGDDCGC
ncbi:MAG: FeoB-associated Cys-rich membrane protein [Flavobacteriaceae bacterium]